MHLYKIIKDIYIFIDFNRKTPAIDADVLSTMKMKGTVGYAPNPNIRKRNQVISYNIRYYLSVIAARYLTNIISILIIYQKDHYIDIINIKLLSCIHMPMSSNLSISVDSNF